MGNSVLIATLASKPQLITLALDCLKKQGDVPQQVLLVTTNCERLPTRTALECLRQDLPRAYPNLAWNVLELQRAEQALQDVTSPEEVETAFHILYETIRRAKLDGAKVHLLISGGRRTLVVFAMAAAQMLFDDEDRLWHIASHPDLEASGALHAREGEWVRLISIPVIPWGRLSPVFDVLRDVTDPFDAARRLEQLRLREQWDAARIFLLTKITPAERQVLDLLAREGLNQSEIAEKLCLSPRTVEGHLRSVYRKAAAHWDLADVNQAQLVRLLSVFYQWTGGR